MKPLLVLLALFFCVATSRAQTTTTSPAALVEAEAPFKKANIILIATNDAPDAAYIKLGQLLVAAGFPIANSNKEFGTISTGSKSAKGGVTYALTTAIIATTTGSQIRLTGFLQDATMEVLYRGAGQVKVPIQYAGMKGSAVVIGWETMLGIAQSYPNGVVRYAKQ